MKRSTIILFLGITLTLLCLVQYTKANEAESSDPAMVPQTDQVADSDSSKDEPNSSPEMDDLDGLLEEDEDEDDDDDDDDLSLQDDDEKEDTIENDWEETLKSTLANKDAYHNKDTILNLAYTHLVYEDVDQLSALRLKHQEKDTKLNDEESASLSNALVVKSYVDEKFGDRSEISNDEAIMILGSERYDKWMDDMPDNVISLLDTYMTDESDL